MAVPQTSGHAYSLCGLADLAHLTAVGLSKGPANQSGGVDNLGCGHHISYSEQEVRDHAAVLRHRG